MQKNDHEARRARGWLKSAPKQGDLVRVKYCDEIGVIEKQLSGSQYSVVLQQAKPINVSIFDLECLDDK